MTAAEATMVENVTDRCGQTAGVAASRVRAAGAAGGCDQANARSQATGVVRSCTQSDALDRATGTVDARVEAANAAEPCTQAAPGADDLGKADGGAAAADAVEPRVQAASAAAPDEPASQAHADGAPQPARGAAEPSDAAAYKKPLPYLAVKRLFDIAFSTCVIVVGLIPGLALSAVIMADTKGSPIYSQVRAGRHGRPFRIYKFRTMVADADDVEKHLDPEQLEAWRRERKVEGDPRITRLGAVLRATSIDEFPQFANVWLGQMSTIGPRAVTFDELEWFGDDKDLLLSMAPGITGVWQTGPRNLATFDSGLRQEMELDYVRHAGLGVDIRTFFRTFRTLAEGTGQ